MTLNVGLTGGIGSGKSTVADRLVQHGAVLIDSDRLARDVVAPGTAGLEAVVAEFGRAVLGPDGALDRGALAARVFGDDDARSRLNGIVHPRVRDRSAELAAAASSDAVVVHDIPLLVEGDMAASFPLVIVVHADAEVRVRRLVDQRGMDEADVRARLAAQATDGQRRAAADVWLDNTGPAANTERAADALWADRLRPFEENLRRGHAPDGSGLVPPDPDWPFQAGRLAAKIRHAGGLQVDHIGSTAVPGLCARPRIDLRLTVRGHAPDMGPAGFAPVTEQCYASADPGRPADLQVCGSTDWQQPLLLRDWLRAEPAVRAEFEAIKREALDEHGPRGYAEAKDRWFRAALPRAQQWAIATGWQARPLPSGL